MKEKKKNFLLLGIIAIITIMLVLYMDFLFEQKNKNRKSFAAKFLSEIMENDFENYVIDNSDAIIYMAKSKDITLNNFEQKFIELINDNELSKEIVYLNTDEVSKQFYQNLKKYYSDDIKTKDFTLSSRPNILIIKDRKIIDVLYKDKKTINENDIEKFLKENDVIE